MRARKKHPVTLDSRAGIGLKLKHCADLYETLPDIGFIEIHAENYMGEGGPMHRWLGWLSEHYELSVHGVGLSIGGSEPLNRTHLGRLRRLIDRYEPQSFSEHLAWSTHEQVFFNDLLPLPYTRTTLRHVCNHIDEVQEALGRRMLLENPTSYLHLEKSDLSETDFLAEVVRTTGCGLLLDVNNVHISSVNLGFDPAAYLAAFPVAHVGEIHLGGFAPDAGDTGLLIDAHGAPIADPVWDLYHRALSLTGPVPTLIEWDNDVPPLGDLLAEARRADAALVRLSLAAE